MSGGPVFALDLEALVPLRMVGIVYEYAPLFEQVFARPLDSVDQLGRIAHPGAAV
jgi:hypothetical protein